MIFSCFYNSLDGAIYNMRLCSSNRMRSGYYDREWLKDDRVIAWQWLPFGEWIL